jgi:hypothetical protein
MELDLPAPIFLLLMECAHAAAQCTDPENTFAKTKKSTVFDEITFFMRNKNHRFSLKD